MNNCNTLPKKEAVQGYIDHGWKLVPIPPMTKGPQHKGWNLRGKELLSADQLPQDWGIGIAHAYSGTCAIDIDNWEQAAPMLKEHGIDLDQLYNALDAVIVDSGREGRGKLLYTMPLGMVLNTKKILFKDDQGVNQTAYELRCATSNGNTVQDVLPSDAVHPVTCQPYRWAGKGHWSRIPQLPFEIFTHWQSLITADQERTIKTDGPLNASWEEIQSALDSINPDCDRDTWYKIGMALEDAGARSEDDETALQLFNDWSAQGEKYQGERDILSVWNSFTPGDGIAIGTLFKTAIDNGWSRPVPDASELFSAVELPTDYVVPVINEVSPFPSELLDPPGLIGEVAQYIKAQSPRPQPVFAVGAALSFLSHASKNQYVIDRIDAAISLYMILVGDTGCGKEAPRKGVTSHSIRSPPTPSIPHTLRPFFVTPS